MYIHTHIQYIYILPSIYIYIYILSRLRRVPPRQSSGQSGDSGQIGRSKKRTRRAQKSMRKRARGPPGETRGYLKVPVPPGDPKRPQNYQKNGYIWESFLEPWVPKGPPGQPRETQGDDFCAPRNRSFWGALPSDLQDRFREAPGSFWESFWSPRASFSKPKSGPAEVCFDCTGVYGSHMGPARKDPQTEPGTDFCPGPGPEASQG